MQTRKSKLNFPTSNFLVFSIPTTRNVLVFRLWLLLRHNSGASSFTFTAATNGASACGYVRMSGYARGVNGVRLSAYLYTRTWLTITTTLEYMIPYSVKFPFLQSRTLTVRPCCNSPVFCSCGIMTFHKKSCKIKYFLLQF